MLDADAPLNCENCATPLEGAYCHACGQHAVNPLRHFAHAFEELFESFWHLDGRAFRTFRDLLVPGRVACNYLAGQRARYIPPLRLFLVLTVLTFFVGQFAVSADADAGVDKVDRHIGEGVVQVDGDGVTSFDKARTPAEVVALRDRTIAEIRRSQRGAKNVPFVGVALDTAQDEVRTKADARLAQLAAKAGSVGTVTPSAAAAKAPSTGSASGPKVTRTGSTGIESFARAVTGGHRRDPKAEWAEETNPIIVDWLPALGNHWVNHRVANAERNVGRINSKGGGPAEIISLGLAAVPSALFVLVPVFALLLRLLYLLSPRGYLEHLVIALYSHAFMLLALLAGFALSLVAVAGAGYAVIPITVTLLKVLLWISVPVYLFEMQRRVYGQHWALTLAKYFALGVAYLILVGMAVVYSTFAGITSSG